MTRLIALTLCTVLCSSFLSSANAERSYKVAIIIDDLGHNLKTGQQFIDLPYQLTYSILPHRPYSKQLADRAGSSGKEVMVHLPMQSSTKVDNLGAGGLTIELAKEEFKDVVEKSIRSIPYAKGVNNHMGSLLTRHPGHMTWLMEVIANYSQQFYFVDSRTTAKTVAGKIAKEHFVPNISRDVFIDNEISVEAIKKQLNDLIRIAKKKGFAVGIGHPYSATMQSLVEFLPTMGKHNVEIVPITTLIDLHHEQQWPRASTWLSINKAE